MARCARGPFRTAEELEAMAGKLLALMPVEEFPHFTEMIVQHALRPGYAYAKEFEVGLGLVLDGLERRLAEGKG